MNLLKSIAKGGRQHELIIAMLLIAYILSGVKTPADLSASLNTVFGKGVVALLALGGFYVFSPVVAVLFALAALELLRRANAIAIHATNELRGTEEQKMNDMVRFNPPTKEQADDGKTLEEEMVQLMAPLVRMDNKNPACSSYSGIVDSGLTMTGVNA